MLKATAQIYARQLGSNMTGLVRQSFQAYFGFDIQRVCGGEFECLWGVPTLPISSCVHCGANDAVNTKLLDIMLDNEIVSAARC